MWTPGVNSNGVHGMKMLLYHNYFTSPFIKNLNLSDSIKSPISKFKENENMGYDKDDGANVTVYH